MDPKQWMEKAITLSREGMQSGQGGPFGAIVVKDDRIVGYGFNQVTSTNDPTAHAEMVAIRNACRNLSTFQLTGCELYTSCEPCPMCLAAIYWARPDHVYYANSRLEAAKIGFDDAFIYDQLPLPPEARSMRLTRLPMNDALEVFKEWTVKADKTRY